MEKPTIIRKLLNQSEYIHQFKISGANFLAPIKWNLPIDLAFYQPFDYYEIYKSLGLSFFFDTVILLGIAKFSIENDGKYVAFVRSDDVIKGRTPSEVKLENDMKSSRYHLGNILSSMRSSDNLNYLDWLNGRKKTYIGGPQLVSIIFSCFTVPFTCYLDLSDMRDFVDALSEMELKNHPCTLSTQYYCFTAEKGYIMAKIFSKSELEYTNEFEDKLTFIGHLKPNKELIFFPKDGISYKVNGFNVCFNPWN